MNGLELTFIDQHQQLQKLAREAAVTRKKLVEFYMLDHFPDVPCLVTLADDNMLSIDLSFPTLKGTLSQKIAQFVTAYLQDLLKAGDEPVLEPCPHCQGMHDKGQVEHCPLNPNKPEVNNAN